MAEYTGEGSGFLSVSFEKVNSSLASFASSYSDIIANEIAPLVALGLTLTFITLGVLVTMNDVI